MCHDRGIYLRKCASRLYVCWMGVANKNSCINIDIIGIHMGIF